MKLPGDGVYKIRAKEPFCAYSYGFSNYDSYGFPTSIGIVDLYSEDTIPPKPVWEMDCNGNVRFASVTDYPAEDSVRSNLSQILFHSLSSENYHFYYDPFTPGETRTTKWYLDIIDPSKDAVAVITFADRRGNDTTIVVEYTPSKLTIRPKLEDFGQLALNNNISKKDFWLINESEETIENITQLFLVKKNQGFRIDYLDNHLPFNLLPNDSVRFQVHFTPTKFGKFDDEIRIGDTCFSWVNSIVNAEVDEPIIEVSDIQFPETDLSEKISRTVTIRNTGIVDLIISGYSGPSNPVYNPIFNREISENDPLILNSPNSKEPNAISNFTFIVEFSPSETVHYTDSIVFHSNANKNDSVCIINGVGILSVEDITNTTSSNLEINSIKPNPSADAVIIIEFNLLQSSKVEFHLYNSTGNKMSEPIENYYSSGKHEIEVSISDLPNGLYLFTIQAGTESQTKKFIISR